MTNRSKFTMKYSDYSMLDGIFMEPEKLQKSLCCNQMALLVVPGIPFLQEAL